MILRAVIFSWLLFQFLQYTTWNLYWFPTGSYVTSQEGLINSQNDNLDIFANFFADNCSETNGSVELTACENCGCSTGNFRLLLPQSTECVITDDILREIYDLIYTAYLKAITPPDTRNPRQFGRFSEDDQGFCTNLTDICRNSTIPPIHLKESRNNDPVCDELIKDIKNMTEILTGEIELLVLLIFDPAGLEIRIRQLENCVFCLRNNLADLVEKAANDTGRCYEDGLGKVYTCFTTEIGKRTERIVELEGKVAAKSYDIITANVLAGNYDAAAKEYHILKNETVFESMTETLYESKEIERILEFGRAIHFNNIRGTYQVLDKLNRLINSSATNDWHNIVFRYHAKSSIQEFCKSPNYCFELGLPVEFAALMRDVIPRTNNSITTWAAGIRQGNFREYIRVGSPEDFTGAGKAFHDVIDELVTRAYQKKTENLANTLNFVHSLRWNSQRYTGYKAMIREASDIEDQLRIAIKMKDTMLNIRGPDGNDTQFQAMFNELKDKDLKASVRAIVWGEKCEFQAIQVNNQYLYVDGTMGYQAGNRRVRTKVGSDANTKWKLEMIDMGNSKYEYRVIHEVYGEYLGPHIPWRFQSWGSPGYEIACTSNPYYIEPERKDYSWEIRFDGGGGDNEVALFHVGRQAYLHGNSDGSVYLAMYGKHTGNTRWKISLAT